MRILGDRLLVRTRKDPAPSGLITCARVEHQAPEIATVLQVGEGKKRGRLRTPMEPREGDTLLIEAYWGHGIDNDQPELRIIDYDRILAIIDREEG